MKRILFILLAGFGLCGVASAACSSTAFGAYTCVSHAGSFNSGTSRAQTISVTAGDAVLIAGQALATGSTLSLAGTGACTGTINGNTSTALAASVAIVGWTTATSTGTCTLTMTWTGTSATLVTSAWDWQGWNGVFDVSGALASTGSNSTSGSCPAVTTTLDGDLVQCLMIDSNNNGGTYTAGSGFSLTVGNNSVNNEVEVQTTHGAITPTFTYGNSTRYGLATITLATGAAIPTYSLAGGTYATSLPRSTTIATSTAGAFLCVTTCTTNGCTPSTPAASTPGTCSAGTQYSTNSQAITLPVGYSTYSSLATKSGLNNSPVVTSSQYQITPTINNWNGVTPTYANGAHSGLNQLNGNWMNPGTGMLGTLIDPTLVAPTTAIPVQNYIDFHGGTNGNNPGATDLGTGTYGSFTSWVASGVGAGLTYSNAQSIRVLPQPVLAGGVAYNKTGTLGIRCTSQAGGVVTATTCASAQLNYLNATGSASLGFWFTSNCDAPSTQDCGNVGGLVAGNGAGGPDYVNLHFNALVGNCPNSGLYIETHTGPGTACLTYTNGAVYRINLQENVGHAAVTVTFSNGSAVISGTNSLATNQAIQLSTTGTLPTNFSACASPNVCFVLSTGLSGSQFELATNQGGTAIVAGSAGSGTHTATQVNLLKACRVSGSSLIDLGTLAGPIDTGARINGGVQVGFAGEGPNTAGFTFDWLGFAVDPTGQFSLTQCIL